MNRKIMLSFVILVVIAGITGYVLYTKKVTNYADENPDYVLSAQELVQAFNKDSTGARTRFMDKIVRVSGNVKALDSSAVVLGEEGNPSDVVVGIDDRNVGHMRRARVGQTAVLQGKFSGYEILSGNPEDLIESLGGTTIKIDYAGFVTKK